jgi:hypothetical protein
VRLGLRHTFIQATFAQWCAASRSRTHLKPSEFSWALSTRQSFPTLEEEHILILRAFSV